MGAFCTTFSTTTAEFLNLLYEPACLSCRSFFYWVSRTVSLRAEFVRCRRSLWCTFNPPIGRRAYGAAASGYVCMSACSFSLFFRALIFSRACLYLCLFNGLVVCLLVRLLRWDFELYRFDLVRYVNQLDSKKVVLLETGINRAFYGTYANGTGVLGA